MGYEYNSEVLILVDKIDWYVDTKSLGIQRLPCSAFILAGFRNSNLVVIKY